MEKILSVFIDILKLMEKALIDTKADSKEFTGTIDCGLMPTFTDQLTNNVNKVFRR